MTGRERLPNRRGHEVIAFCHGGFSYRAGVGRFDNGRVAEIFLNVEKTGTAVEAHAREAAIAASLAMQHGATATEIRHALPRNADGSAAGPLGALLDLLAIVPIVNGEKS